MTVLSSQFASSLNQIGVSYKIAYSVSLTLRYSIPDVQEENIKRLNCSEAESGIVQKAKLIKWI